VSIERRLSAMRCLAWKERIEIPQALEKAIDGKAVDLALL